jgi:hypothetical protein
VSAETVRAGDRVYLAASLEPATVLRTMGQRWVVCRLNDDDDDDDDDASGGVGGVGDSGEDEESGGIAYLCDALLAARLPSGGP